MEEKLISEHWTFGPDASKLSPDELENVKNEARKNVMEWHDLPEVEKMRLVIYRAYEELSKAIRYTQRDIRDPSFFEITDDRRRLLEIFGHIESSMMALGNHVRNDPKGDEIRAKVNAWWEENPLRYRHPED